MTSLSSKLISGKEEIIISIKVLVVDDSAFMRKIISDQIKSSSGLSVCGIARDGEDALRLIPKLKPDLITLDIEMPGLNGLETLKKIKADFQIPVIMLSSQTGEDITIEALELGAMDFIEKPQNLQVISQEFQQEISTKIKLIYEGQQNQHRLNKKAKPILREQVAVSSLPLKVKCIVIGASTGGPRALMNLVKDIPKELNIPMIIVQHMPAGFTHSFAKRLNQEAQVSVVEAENGMKLQKGTIYLAPGDYHLRIVAQRIVLEHTLAKRHGVRPAVDFLFESAADDFKTALVAVILTGMGSDGTAGMKKIKALGGYNIAQDEGSSVVFGMPRQAIEAGVVDEVMSLQALSKRLNWIIKVRQG